MKKALILYWHGLGDIIQLTPHLRHLYNQGYVTDLMCMEQTAKSKLLDDCPYTDELISVPNTWTSPLGFNRQAQVTIERFNGLKTGYDWSGMANHIGIGGHNKMDFTAKELGLGITDKILEVFISQEVEQGTLEFINNEYPDGYIFVNTFVEEHTYHDWDASGWIKANLPPLQVIDVGYKGAYYMWTDDINDSFVLLREATHRVLSSSVMVHACEAMNVKMDVINYGRPDRKVWSANQDLVLRIRENGVWIK